MGCTVVWRAPNDIIVITPQNHNIYMRVENENIEYQLFWKDDYSFLDEPWHSHRVGMKYINVNGTIYYLLYEFPNMLDCHIYRDGNDIYLDSGMYYKDNYTIYKDIGRKINVNAYINDIKIDTPVFQNTGWIDGLNNFSDFVLLRPVFEKLEATITFVAPNKIVIENDTLGKIVISASAYVNTDQNKVITFKDGDSDCYIVDGKTYIRFSGIRVATDGSLKQNGNNIYVYTPDFERHDIPATLQEAYKYFDENLSPQDIDFIKNCTADELSLTHLGLGMWIRNNWIYPTDERIAKVFLDKGITNPDDISGLIIAGYKLYLNGLPCEIDDIK
jgi:hypothetical protein